MNEKVLIVIFVLIFLLIYTGINYFVLNQLAKYFSWHKNIIFYLFLSFAALSYILASMLEANFGNIFTRIFYILSATWMGFMFMLFFILFILWMIGLFIKLPAITGIAALVLVMIICFYGMLSVGFVKITEVKLYSDKIDDPISIVHLSDLHLGPVHDKKFLEKAIYHTNKIDPDYVFITGDLVDGRYQYPLGYFNPLNNIKSKTYFVIGNHDAYAGTERVMNLLKNINISVLRNQEAITDELQIIGLDDSENKTSVLNQLENFDINNKKYSVLLYHRPDIFKTAASKHIDLMLTGHTHAGQFIPFNLLTKLFLGYNHGLYQIGISSMYVSAGIGTWGPPMRIGSRSEIVHIMIYPK